MAQREDGLVTGKVVEATWLDQLPYRGLTLGVEHEDGSHTYIVVEIKQMTDRIQPKPTRKAGGR